MLFVKHIISTIDKENCYGSRMGSSDAALAFHFCYSPDLDVDADLLPCPFNEEICKIILITHSIFG